MVYYDGGMVSKQRKITDKNTLRGQESLNNFFGPTHGTNEPVKANSEAFKHYVISTNAYQKFQTEEFSLAKEKMKVKKEPKDEHRKRDKRVKDEMVKKEVIKEEDNPEERGCTIRVKQI